MSDSSRPFLRLLVMSRRNLKKAKPKIEAWAKQLGENLSPRPTACTPNTSH